MTVNLGKHQKFLYSACCREILGVNLSRESAQTIENKGNSRILQIIVSNNFLQYVLISIVIDLLISLICKRRNNVNCANQSVKQLDQHSMP